jgi:hypothetical protein
MIISKKKKKKTIRLARSHDLVVKADGSRPRGHGFKPRHRILEGCKRFGSYYIEEQDLLGQVSRLRKREGQKYVNFYGKS